MCLIPTGCVAVNFVRKMTRLVSPNKNIFLYFKTYFKFSGKNYWQFYYFDHQWKPIFIDGSKIPAYTNNFFYWFLSLMVLKNGDINVFITALYSCIRRRLVIERMYVHLKFPSKRKECEFKVIFHIISLHQQKASSSSPPRSTRQDPVLPFKDSSSRSFNYIFPVG